MNSIFSHYELASNYIENTECAVAFCGLRICFENLDHRLIPMIQTRYGKDPGKDAFDCVISVKVNFRQVIFRPSQLFTGPNGYAPLLRALESKVLVQGPGFEGVVSLGPQISGQLDCNDHDQFLKATVYENFLRIISSYAIFQKGGLFMHSAAVLVDGQAYLFIGRSNAGKTTISRTALAAGHFVLSDDANMIYPDDSARFVANAVPFAGELGQTGPRDDGPFPVAGIFWLEKSDETIVESLGVADRVSRLMVCSPVLNVDPYRQGQLIERLEKIVHEIPVMKLKFSKQDSFEKIFKQINEAGSN